MGHAPGTARTETGVWEIGEAQHESCYTRARVILTPEDFRQRTRLDHHVFGGIAPVQGAARVMHQTPIQGLWFISTQSESGGGINNVIPGAYRVARKTAAN